MIFKRVFQSLLFLIFIAITWLVLSDSLFHPLQSDELEYDLFGEKVKKIEIKERIDFIGVTPHGDIFDFYEYGLDSVEINSFIKSKHFNKLPYFSAEAFSKASKTQKVELNKWERTPLKYTKDNYLKGTFIPSLLDYGNFYDHEASKEFAVAEYLNKDGNYVAFRNAYPHGYFILFVLAPKEGKLYIIRKS